MTKDTSSPAFPFGGVGGGCGLTKREWYAGMALQGLITAGYGSSLSFMSLFETHKRTYARLDSIPEIAFDIADQMLATSEKEQKP